VTQFVAKHPEPVDPKTFTLSDEDYQQFVHWMKDKDYAYKSYLEYELEELTKEAQKEKYYPDLKNQLEQMATRIQESKKNELMLQKSQIRMLLEEEIVARFHLESGSVQAGFKYDNDVKKAIEILRDSKQYRKILNIQ
jgi:carboxyl-terminal processing protease